MKKTVRQLHLEAIIEHLEEHEWRFGAAVVHSGKALFNPEDLKAPDGTLTPGVVLFARRETADDGAYSEDKKTVAIQIAVVSLLDKEHNPLWRTEEIRGEVLEVMGEITFDESELYYTDGDVQYPRKGDPTLYVVLLYKLEYYCRSENPYAEARRDYAAGSAITVEADKQYMPSV